MRTDSVKGVKKMGIQTKEFSSASESGSDFSQVSRDVAAGWNSGDG